MQKFYIELLDGVWESDLTTLIGHLRRQQNLSDEIGSQCPKFADTRWLSMDGTTTYMMANRIRIRNHLTNRPRNKPSQGEVFWLLLVLCDFVASESATTFRQLQGKEVTYEQQDTYLGELQTVLINEFEMEECDADDQVGDDVVKSSNGATSTYSMELDTLFDWFSEQRGLKFSAELATTIKEEDETKYTDVCKDIAQALVNLVQGIANICVERDDANNPTSTLPPLYSMSVFEMDGGLFTRVLHEMEPRLLNFGEADIVSKINDEFLAYRQLYRRDRKLPSQLLQTAEGDASFDAAWAPIKDRFPNLYNFFGTLATVFPGTPVVESDFSVLKWTKDDHNRSLSDFSLEGKLHARQWAELNELVPEKAD